MRSSVFGRSKRFSEMTFNFKRRPQTALKRFMAMKNSAAFSIMEEIKGGGGMSGRTCAGQ